MRLILILLVILTSTQAISATYYIRPGGGASGTCDGTVNVDAPGTDGHCAWNHPFEALGVNGSSLYPQRISGGDTVIIASGSYKMGRDDTVYNDNGCYSGYPWGCYMASLPAGSDKDHPTRILGEGWDNGCSSPPELYGVERVNQIIYLKNTSYIDIRCLEITDHSNCTKNTSLAQVDQCSTSYPYGDRADLGMYAYNVNTLNMADVNIHGVTFAGVKAAEITDWTMTDCSVSYNGAGGMNLQVEGDVTINQFYGDILLKDSDFSWNGCIEDYPNDGEIVLHSCVGGNSGGFGDAIGFQRQDNGVQVEVDNCTFIGNVEDAFDALYLRTDSTNLSYVHNSYFAYNAGDDIKTGGSAIVENNTAVGDCTYFRGKDIDSGYIVHCRGNATLSVTLQEDSASATIVNNSFGGQADQIISISSSAAGSTTCDGTERVYMANNIFRSGSRVIDPETVKVDAYFIYDTCTGFAYTAKNNVFYNNKDGANDCVDSTDSICSQDPKYVSFDESTDTYDFKLQSDSPAIDVGLPVGTSIGYNLAVTTVPSIDLLGNARDTIDIGAYEYGASGATCSTQASLCTNQTDCETAGWYWYNDVCNSSPQQTSMTKAQFGAGTSALFGSGTPVLFGE